MRDLVRKAKSFIIFDFQLEPVHISEQFTSTHRHYQQQFPYWSLEATRKKLISVFWFRQVLFHYGAILALAIFLVMPSAIRSQYLLMPLFFAGGISFVILILFHYWPTYYSDFLPTLDTIIAEQEKQMAVREEIKKCKRTQFSIPALTIIFYVFSKTVNIPLLPSNDHSAELLNNLYGADKDKLKQNLSRLYKLSQLSPKERAEIQKGITTSRAFFEALDCKPAQIVLDQLEIKTNRAQLDPSC